MAKKCVKTKISVKQKIKKSKTLEKFIYFNQKFMKIAEFDDLKKPETLKFLEKNLNKTQKALENDLNRNRGLYERIM